MSSTKVAVRSVCCGGGSGHPNKVGAAEIRSRFDVGSTCVGMTPNVVWPVDHDRKITTVIHMVGSTLFLKIKSEKIRIKPEV